MIIIKKRGILFLICSIILVLTAGLSVTASLTSPRAICIYIDPGHGGFDGGTTSLDKAIIEKDITLEVSLKLAHYLRRTGYLVKLTRETDMALGSNKKEDIHKRVSLINESKANLYVSIHANSYPSRVARGAQVFYQDHNSENVKLAKSIMKTIKALDDSNKRVASLIKDKYLVDHITVTGCLIELGFLSNDSDLNSLTNQQYLDDLVQMIYLGIMEYLETI